MDWVVRIAEDAQEFVDSLPPKPRRQIATSITQMEEDPFRGDVKPLKGQRWDGSYRKRAGDYRIIFGVDHKRHVVDVFWVQLRSEKNISIGIANRRFSRDAYLP
jgi:mRNA-degrading endonuclease RelE of RelBE toxin-antitoxin system